MFTANEYSLNPFDVGLPDSSGYRHENSWLPLTYRVVDKNAENKDLVTFTYEPTTEASIEPIQPGQFNMLYAFGVGEIPISVSSVLADQKEIIHTIQDVGAVSHALCSMNIGDEIGVRGPFGSVWPVETAKYKDIIIMSGGVGFAPLKPVIELIANDRDNYGEVNFLYGTRNPVSIIFHQDVISLQSDPSINFLITVDHSFSNWRGNVGVVTSLIEKSTFDPEHTIGFVCGPEIMMRYGAYALSDAGLNDQNIFLSMERNMKCALGQCGRCQYGPFFVCKEGPVFQFSTIKDSMRIREL